LRNLRKRKRTFNCSFNCLNNNSGLMVQSLRSAMEEFRVPIHLDNINLYITEAQMQFYLNGISPAFRVRDILNEGKVSKDFLIYYEKCIVYNLIWDLAKKYPRSSKMYWDDNFQEIRITYPKNGMVFKALKKHGLSPSTL